MVLKNLLLTLGMNFWTFIIKISKDADWWHWGWIAGHSLFRYPRMQKFLIWIVLIRRWSWKKIIGDTEDEFLDIHCSDLWGYIGFWCERFTQKIVPKYPFVHYTGENCTFIVKVTWETEPFKLVEFYSKDSLEIFIHQWHLDSNFADWLFSCARTQGSWSQ